MFKNISIKAFLCTISGVLAFASLLFAWQLMSAFDSINQTRKQLENIELQVETFKDVRYHVVQIQQFLTDVAATRLQEGFGEAEGNLRQAQDGLETIIRLNPDLRAQIEVVKQQIDALNRTGVQMAWDYINLGVEAGNASMKKPETGLDDTATRVAKKLDVLAGQLDNNLRNSATKLNDSMKWYSMFLTAIAFGFALVVAAGLWMAYLKIEPPLRMIKQSLIAIKKGGGDLRSRLPDEGENEIGEIVTLFNDFLTTMQDLIRNIAAETDHLVSSSIALSGMSERAKVDMQKQQNSTDEVATTMAELSATVAEVANNTYRAADIATKSRSAASAGKDTVATTVTSIHALSSGIDEASAVIANVENDCENVSSVLDVIQSIADQTNLLALNAAIEAARAGEQGRGFAVVADEVRTLASRTQGSTQEIHSMIERLQKGSRDAVKAMGDSQGQVKRMVEVIESAGNVLGNIVGMTGEISEMNSYISNAVKEQKIVVEHINKNVLAINDVTASNTADSEQAAKEALHLHKIAMNLQNSISGFKI